MSQMIPQPPPSIQIGGNAPPGSQGPGPSANGPGDPDSKDVVGLLRKALDLVHQAAQAEQDDQDSAAITKLASGIANQIGAEQGLQDSAMGAGPGVKLIRKTGGGAGPSGPAGPGL